MELVNATRKAIDSGCGPADPAVREAAEAVAIMLSLVAPYTAEEMWERLGHEPTVARAGWPAVDEALLVEDTVTAVVQVQGKVRARLEVAAVDQRRGAGGGRAGRPGRRAQPGGQDRPQGHRPRAQPGQHRRGLIARRDRPGPVACAHAEGRRRHRLDGVVVRRGGRGARHPRGAAPGGRSGRTSYDDGVDPEASPEHVAKALKEYVPVSTSRPSPSVVLEAYERAAAEGAEEIVSVHLSAEVSATYESALLAAQEVAGAGAHRRHAGRSAPARGTPRCAAALAVRRRGDGQGGRRGGAAPCPAGDLAVLRRHPRVPPARRPGRRCRRAVRLGPCGQADPLRRGRPHRAEGEGAHGRSRARPAGGPRGRGGRRRRTSTSRCATWPTPTARRRSPRSSPTGCPRTWATVRSRSPRSGPCWEPTSGRAWSASWSPPPASSPQPRRRRWWRGPGLS